MRVVRRWLNGCAPLLVAAALNTPSLGCSGGVTSGSGGGATGTGGTSGTGGAFASCPASAPANGSPCTPPPPADAGVFSGSLADCSWGDDPRPTCRTTALCDAGTWKVTTPTCSTPPLPSACPASPPADMPTCSDQTVTCWYTNGTHCWCSDCAGGSGYPNCQTISPPEWFCAAPGAGCPTVMPQAGTSCDVEGASCGPDCSFEILCNGGIWHWLKGSCPICAAPDTPIATPMGERPIASLRVGDPIYSVDHGAIVSVPIARVGKTRVTGHHVMRIVLDTGAVLEISPGHPTADNRTLGELRAGSVLDPEHTIVSAELVAYAYDATYDVLPASSTGTYFAAGALIGSTMRPGTPEP